MKTVLISLLMVVVVLIGGIYILNYLEESSDHLNQDIEDIESLVKLEKWEEARLEFDEVLKKWDSMSKLWMTTTSHEEIDNIEMTMYKSKEYIEGQERVLSLAELTLLKYYFEHIYTKEKVNIHNVF